MMDVQLYVYDLSQGLARQMSRQFLGKQIDAVYHTALVFGGVEYFFGQGVQTSYPASTHHGRPMEILPMGQTSLPMDVILEYLESLKQIYTAESYDLFVHNCNNFTHDFSTFLVGRGIPEHITSLPQTVLSTPFGQMLRPQLDRAMRGITQAPVPPQNVPSMRSGTIRAPTSVNSNGRSVTVSNGNGTSAKLPAASFSVVHNVATIEKLTYLLKEANSSCAVIFFTSASCPPCKIVYPTYDELAEEAGTKAILIKVDISNADEVASKYSIRATPTFITFLRGRREESWSGANPSQLRDKVRALIQAAFPPHPHQTLKLPTFQRTSLRPVVFSKVPPLEKVIAKMGDAGRLPAVEKAVEFIVHREKDGACEAPLPDLPALSTFLRQSLTSLPTEVLFSAYDLLRLMLVDPRVSGYFADESAHTVPALLQHVNSLSDCPYNLRLVTLHLACNLSTSSIFAHFGLCNPELSNALVTLVSNSLLDKDHPNLRVAAASLAFNLATAEHKARVVEGVMQSEPYGGLPENLAVELTASSLETLMDEQSVEVIKAIVLVIARLFYCGSQNSEILDLCRVMDASAIVKSKEKLVGKEDKALIAEVSALLGHQ